MNVYVRLACGHDRVAPQWGGYVGSTYCCDVCHVLTAMEEVRRTPEAPCVWRFEGQPLPNCIYCGAIPGWHHSSRCLERGHYRPEPLTEARA